MSEGEAGETSIELDNLFEWKLLRRTFDPDGPIVTEEITDGFIKCTDSLQEKPDDSFF